MDVDESDLLLLERLRGGDSNALEALMGQYAARVYRLAYGITRARRTPRRFCRTCS